MVRDGIETVRRKTVVAIIKHWSEDKYYCLHWEKYNWKTFIIGGIEENESAEEAAVRETKEESGYQDIKRVTKIGGEVHSNFFAGHKGVNRYADTECYLVELAGDAYKEPDPEHIKNHRGMWVSGSEIGNFVNLDVHEWYCNALQRGESAYVNEGVLIDSDKWTDLSSADAKEKMIEWLEKEGIGKRKVNYKMRDWVFSRQRYWGEPIPIVHCEKCGAVGVPEKDLPVLLPEVEHYEPTGTGEGPLATIEEWVNTKCPTCGGPAKRETNTMPQWAGSSWYYLRYIDPKNDNALIDKEKEKKWMPVDLYVGGAEHATRHLLYARFWHKFLYDIGVVSTIEPFKKLVHVGLIMAEDGRKMSKRWNNVVNPDDVIAEFGADAMRIYEMFMGPFTQSVAWSTNSVSGVYRFLEKVYKISEKVEVKSGKGNTKVQSLLHKTIKKVTEDIENFRFNTAVSALMILVNAMEKEEQISAADYRSLITLLSPFAPHIAEELNEKLGNKKSIFLSEWPKYDPELAKDEEVEMVVQVNGKVRDRLIVAADVTEDEIKETALESEKIKAFTEGKEVKKIIFVPGRLINIVVN